MQPTAQVGGLWEMRDPREGRQKNWLSVSDAYSNAKGIGVERNIKSRRLV